MNEVNVIKCLIVIVQQTMQQQFSVNHKSMFTQLAVKDKDSKEE